MPPGTFLVTREQRALDYLSHKQKYQDEGYTGWKETVGVGSRGVPTPKQQTHGDSNPLPACALLLCHSLTTPNL